jgi:cysteinyl-tRNA synthetase
MDDDFNTAGAIGYIFDLVKSINQARADGINQQQLDPAQQVFNELTGVLGLQLKLDDKGGSNADAFIDLLITLRRELRQQKNWEMSDRIRIDLKNLGVVLEDGKDRTAWSWE